MIVGRKSRLKRVKRAIEKPSGLYLNVDKRQYKAEMEPVINPKGKLIGGVFKSTGIDWIDRPLAFEMWDRLDQVKMILLSLTHAMEFEGIKAGTKRHAHFTALNGRLLSEYKRYQDFILGNYSDDLETVQQLEKSFRAVLQIEQAISNFLNRGDAAGLEIIPGLVAQSGIIIDSLRNIHSLKSRGANEKEELTWLVEKVNIMRADLRKAGKQGEWRKDYIPELLNLLKYEKAKWVMLLRDDLEKALQYDDDLQRLKDRYKQANKLRGGDILITSPSPI